MGRKKKITSEEESGPIENVRISSPKIKVVKVKLVGDTPFIPHRFSEEAMLEILASQTTKIKQPKGKRDIEQEYQNCFYKNEKGELYIPGEAFARSMVTCAADLDGVKGTEIKRNVRVVSSECVIQYDKIVPKLDHIVMNGRGANVVKRPYIHGWSTEIIVQHNSKMFSGQDILNLLQTAGRAVGVGCWRPEKGGNFGTFHVKEGVN